MKGVNKENIKEYALNEFLSEYKELNTDNKYRPVAVGRYGIRKRESIYSKELAKDYSKNKLIHKDTLTVGMGSKQIDIGILIEDETFAVSPAYHTYEIQGIRCKYLEYCLQSRNIEMFSLYAKRGSRQGKSIDLKRWLTYKIPVYSEEDQMVIEDNLNKINYVIELRRKQLELLDELVRARFVEMFGDPIYNTQNRPMTEFINVVKMQRGYDLPVQDRNHEGSVPVYGANGVLGYHDIAKISDGGIITGRSGTIGKVYLANKEYWPLNTSLFSIETYGNNLIYLQYLVTLYDLKRFVEGTGVPTLNRNMFHNKKIIEVPINEQNTFASFVEEVDKSRLLSNHSLSLIKSITF